MHPLAWLTWLAAAALSTLLTRNPLDLLLLFFLFVLVLDTVTRSSERAEVPVPISPLRFALFAIPVGALFNGLTSHVGETILIRLPSQLPLIGGRITAEALAFGAINGLVLATLFAAFAVLNAAVPVHYLISYLPRAFYPMAVVSAIAVSFVPNTLQQFRQVREAQAVRGHRMRGIRDWLPLFMPVLIGGLERALQLAETMTARGFAGASDAQSGVGVRVTSVAGLLMVLSGGVVRLLPMYAAGAPFLLLGGTGMIILAVWRAGASVRRTRYHRLAWTWRDGTVVIGAVAAVLPLLIWSTSHAYSPYPELAAPPFDYRVGLGLLGFMVPVVWPSRVAEAAS